LRVNPHEACNVSADYRDRVYQSYATTRPKSLTPKTVDSFNPQAPYLRRIIRSHFPTDKSASILELGCGSGMFVYFIREAGYRNVIGIDTSAEQIAVANKLGIEGVREGDLFETLSSLAHESCDVVLMCDVLEHFRKDEMFDVADEIHRVLRGEGKWILRVPNAQAPFAMGMRYGDLTHQQVFTMDSLSQLLRASGFRSVAGCDDAPIVSDLKSALRAVLWQSMRAWLRLWLSVETGGLARTALFSQNFIAVATK